MAKTIGGFATTQLVKALIVSAPRPRERERCPVRFCAIKKSTRGVGRVPATWGLWLVRQERVPARTLAAIVD
jgi:hypothetical protein